MLAAVAETIGQLQSEQARLLTATAQQWQRVQQAELFARWVLLLLQLDCADRAALPLPSVRPHADRTAC